MRHISADYIFIDEQHFLPKGIIDIDENGIIHDVIDTHGNLQESDRLEFYNGILVPGFVNAHCHLELSHMKGMITPHTGLHGFVKEIIAKRFTPENLPDILTRADAEMRAEGIVAVGDISNTADSFDIKRNSRLHYHTFLELFTSKDALISELLEKAKQTEKSLKQLPGNFVPHAAYTVSPKLYDAVNRLNAGNPEAIISIHNQETAGEDELFRTQNGPLYDTLSAMGFSYDEYHFSGKSALQSNLPRLPKDNNILLIHNIYTQPDDIDFAEGFSDSMFWTFCPASNLYIEERLPDIPLFYNKGVKTCIGTDSYASNTRLSILNELKIIHQHFPDLPMGKLLESACINGAKALNMDKRYGSFAPGKQPGVNLLTNIDYKSMQLTDETDVQVLV